MEVAVICEEDEVYGDDSRRLPLIPLTGKWQEAVRSSQAARRSSGQRGTAGKTGGYEARVSVLSSQRREKQRGKELTRERRR
jgi:hypothetical protein